MVATLSMSLTMSAMTSSGSMAMTSSGSGSFFHSPGSRHSFERRSSWQWNNCAALSLDHMEVSKR
jgi:hypothetical protein